MTGSGSDAGNGRMPPAGGESRRTVIVAIIVNVGVAIAKLAAGIFTGSSALMAEAFHAMADTGNEVLLLIAQWRGAVPADDDHRLGHGREAYFWALIASLGVFATGTLLSLRQGINELIHPTEANHFVVAYIVLAISFCLEGMSLLRAYRQIKREAGTLQREFLEHLDLTSDPVARAVFAEDAAAVVGNVIAFTGIALHQATGSPIPDGISAILIAVLLGYVAFDLARRNRDFIIGRQASPAIRSRIRETIATQPGIVGVGELLVSFLGPRQVWVVARVDIDNGMTGKQVKAALRAIEDELKGQSPYIDRVYLIPSER
jgi:cation diffusion facilitator family transporter